MTEAMWLTGLFGCALGGSLALPLVQRRVSRGWHAELVLGIILALAAAIAALIALRHGDRLNPLGDGLAGHFVNVIGLVIGPLVVRWVHLTLRTPLAGMWRRGVLWSPLCVYLAAIPLVGARQSVPFIWILPIAIGFTFAAFASWRDARRSRTGSEDAIRFVGGVVAFSFAVNLAQAARTFWPHVGAMREAVTLTLTLGFLGLCALSIRSFVQRSLGRSSRSGEAKYERSPLRETLMQDVLERLDRVMAGKRAFVHRDLTLRGAASLLDVTPHVLSEALNRVRGEPFLHYLAALRVEEAKRQLEDRSNDRFTIDAIAEACGFASRSAFYNTFRRLAGTTPTEFRKQARAGTDA